MPTALERAGDFSQSTDNNGNPYPVHPGSAADGRVHRADADRRGGHDGLLPGRRRGRPDPGGSSLPDRAEHPEALSAAEHARQRPRARTATTTRSPAVGEHALVAAGGPPRLSADAETARDVQVLGVDAAGPALPGIDSRLQRHENARRARRQLHDVGQLHAHVRRCSWKRPTGTARTSWPAAPRRSRRTGAIFCNNAAGTQGVPMTDVGEPAGRRAGESALPVPQRHGARSGLLRRQSAERAAAGVLGRHAGWPRSPPSRGAAGSPMPAATAVRVCAAHARLPRLAQHQLHQRLLDQPDEGDGAPHDQDRVLQHAQLQGRADQQQRVRHDQLPAGHRHQSRSIRRSGSPTRRSAPSARSSRRESTSRPRRSTTTRRPTSRTTGRSATG